MTDEQESFTREYVCGNCSRNRGRQTVLNVLTNWKSGYPVRFFWCPFEDREVHQENPEHPAAVLIYRIPK